MWGKSLLVRWYVGVFLTYLIHPIDICADSNGSHDEERLRERT